MMPIYPHGVALDEVVHEKPLVVLEVGNDFCSACPAINRKLAAQLQNDVRIGLYYISLNMEPTLAADLQIFSAPAVLVYVNGKLTIKEAGYFSLEDIFSRIYRYLDLLEDKGQ